MAMKVKHKENITILGLLSITILTGVLLALPNASADDIVTDVSITVPAICSITTNTNDNTAHSATVDPGTYESNIGKTTIKTICNDSNGFSIYAIGYTNEEYGNTTLRPNTLDPTQNSIITGTATSAGTPDTSNWAMKISPVTGTYAPTIGEDTDGSFSNYHKVPSTYTKVATKSSGTDITTGSSIEITYSAYIAGTQPADLYNGKVKFTMVHPATEQPLQPQTTQSGKICYYPNGSNVDGTMGCQTVSTSATSATLLASNFSRTGYGFAGWTDSFDYATNANARFYGPNEDISFTAGQYTGDNNGLSLYAVWIKSAGSLQDSTKVATLCGTGTGSLTTAPTDGTANLASISALTDSRDNQTYAIAKLADGKCWMIENLRLESTASHNSDGTLAQGYNATYIGLATAESEHFSDSDTTANSLYTTESNIEGKNTISGDYQAYRFPRYNNTNTSARASSPTANSGSMYSYGNYYTWHVAIADTTHYSSGDHGTTSICPSGWRLPQGNTTSAGFGKLDVEIGGTGAYQSTSEASLRWRKFPVNFLYSGYFYTSSASSRGSYGSYWSSTASSNYGSYSLYLYSSNVYPGTISYYKGLGVSVRCLAS